MNTEKIAIVVFNDMASWQKLNVTSFLASSIAIAFPVTHGTQLTDAQNQAYLPFVKMGPNSPWKKFQKRFITK